MPLRFLVRIQTGKDKAFSGSVRSLAASMGSTARNPKWTSYGALEMDIFSPTKEDFDLFLEALKPLGRLEFSKDLNLAPGHLSDEDAVSEARTLFNSERYWESHEVLEGVWRKLKGEDKSFLQGVILVCAAYVHHQKGEEAVAMGVLARAQEQLTLSRPDYLGIDVNALARAVKKISETGTFDPFRI